MPIRRMQATIYFVTDWDAAIAFYRDVLGLKEVVNFPNRWALFGVPGGGCGTVGVCVSVSPSWPARGRLKMFSAHSGMFSQIRSTAY